MKRELMQPFSMGEMPSKRARLGVIEYSSSLSSLNVRNAPKLTEKRMKQTDSKSEVLHITQNDDEPKNND